MATEIGKLYYDISVDDSKLKRGLDSADNSVEKTGGKFGKFGTAAVAGVAVAGAALAKFSVSSVKAFTESEDAVAQTNAVLKSTGGTAGVTAGMVDELSKSLQNTTRFSDEQARSAQNMLLTFTNIGKDVFPQATEAVADMATAMGQDLTQTSIQVGKALQDPVQGVTALQRVGVRLTDSQKAVVEQLVATGDTAGAQRVILEELRKEFGGSAKAAGETFAGRLTILQNKLNDVQEVIGQKLVGALFALGEAFQDVSEFLMRHKLLLAAIAGILTVLAVGILVSVISALGTLVISLIATGAAWLVAMGPVLLIGAAIGAIAYLIVTNWETVKNFFTGLWNWFTTNWPYLLAILTGPFGLAVLAIVKNWDTLKQWFTNAWTWFKDIGQKIGSGIANGISGAVEGVKNTVKAALNWIIDKANTAIRGVNKVSPPGVPELGEIPKFRNGVENFAGGLAFVHKNEALVNLSPGTSVIKASEADKMGSGGNTYKIDLTVNGAVATSKQALREMSVEIFNAFNEGLRSQGKKEVGTW